jgi:hypothetical protein
MAPVRKRFYDAVEQAREHVTDLHAGSPAFPRFAA